MAEKQKEKSEPKGHEGAAGDPVVKAKLKLWKENSEAQGTKGKSLNDAVEKSSK